MNNPSPIITRMLGLTYPIIIIFGMYVIVNGHRSPGGGFQGGGILAAVFIGRYLVKPVEDIKIHSLQIIEKIVFLLIWAVIIFFVLTLFHKHFSLLNETYLILMNILIGIKVFCGLSIIFFRFVFYESR